MAVQKDNALALHAEECYPNDPIESDDAVAIMKRLNAQEELITDATCTGGAGRTYRGHDHIPGSADTPGRGIMRMAVGGFQLTRSSNPYTAYTYSGIDPKSVAKDALYVNGYEAGIWTGSAVSNYVMGKIFVSVGIDSVRFDVCAKTGDTLAGGPQFRIKNLTDTNATNTEVVATEWIDIDLTSPKWYGPDNEEKLTLSITKSTSVKEVDLDIEVRNQFNNSTNTPFVFYCVIAYEYTDEK